ncbi:DUF4268 domain-containing protein [Aurantibacter crassamenti]|uniref:DUF4268 domain-containing protein n=1 Tax=Aurantibacter crassamenti TaxID=1837375 RepID=UPI00193A614E|nr:DUF4268 domain-containing protein [Aurantibacter crassamenti]MBM1106650.1 DUF4268 domain-containing protein [Aurantibacter crassamenti]
MFSKEESKKLRQEFWIAFGKSYPRKWILYNTRIKGLQFKFDFDVKKARVAMDVDTDNLERRILLWEKLISLKSILTDEYWPEAIFDDSYLLENGKEISRIYLEKDNVSIHNKNSWQETMQFLDANMKQLEAFFLEYKDIIDNLE